MCNVQISVCLCFFLISHFYTLSEGLRVSVSPSDFGNLIRPVDAHRDFLLQLLCQDNRSYQSTTVAPRRDFLPAASPCVSFSPEAVDKKLKLCCFSLWLQSWLKSVEMIPSPIGTNPALKWISFEQLNFLNALSLLGMNKYVTKDANDSDQAESLISGNGCRNRCGAAPWG